MKRIAFIALFFLASCAHKEIEMPLEVGTYFSEVEVGTVCVDILDESNCDVYFPGCDVSHGTYSWHNKSLQIEGTAIQPHKNAVVGQLTEGWRNIYSFSSLFGGHGEIVGKITFTYYLSVERPLYDRELKQYIFTKKL